MTAATPTATTKVRLRFAKHGDLRLVSHHDLMRCLERAIRRAGLPVAHSQGFNPRPKLVFTLALALGIEGRREVLEIELGEPISPADLVARLAAVAPPGLDFFEADAVPQGRSSQAVAAEYEFEVPEERREAARAALAELLARESQPYTRHRPDRTVEIDVRPAIEGACLDPSGSLRLRLKISPEGSVRPEEVIDSLGLRDLLERGVILARTDIEIR